MVRCFAPSFSSLRYYIGGPSPPNPPGALLALAFAGVRALLLFLLAAGSFGGALLGLQLRWALCFGSLRSGAQVWLVALGLASDSLWVGLVAARGSRLVLLAFGLWSVASLLALGQWLPLSAWALLVAVAVAFVLGLVAHVVRVVVCPHGGLSSVRRVWRGGWGLRVVRWTGWRLEGKCAG
jgi:hypothetical protein